jgi:hypothetical protein
VLLALLGPVYLHWSLGRLRQRRNSSRHGRSTEDLEASLLNDTATSKAKSPKQRMRDDIAQLAQQALATIGNLVKNRTLMTPLPSFGCMN